MYIQYSSCVFLVVFSQQHIYIYIYICIYVYCSLTPNLLTCIHVHSTLQYTHIQYTCTCVYIMYISTTAILFSITSLPDDDVRDRVLALLDKQLQRAKLKQQRAAASLQQAQPTKSVLHVYNTLFIYMYIVYISEVHVIL